MNLTLHNTYNHTLGMTYFVKLHFLEVGILKKLLHTSIHWW